MLLGSTQNNTANNADEVLIADLIRQGRYAEAYVLLKRAPTDEAATWYNLALCLYWLNNYRQTIMCLDHAQAQLPVHNNSMAQHTDEVHKALTNKQNQTNDHLQSISKKYVAQFTGLVYDAILRLKTDCWLLLGEYSRVIELASPLAYKNYRNVNDALQIAKNKLNHDK
ncbi:hypothetical protein LJ707_09580 [Mucilaginibacter sp. UR6-1]|uniref:hypothetical protein n=1 Tax=Mucilaginibacter sp. UR6-1 TaxID=1435643 RepID=UPI001E29BCB2|nr:hypothetical protein [Mucilaginibacter sp. UR6-1]MCC8409182.1 hypothetical protein [Mucilaginibacter sp. UR6-1]